MNDYIVILIPAGLWVLAVIFEIIKIIIDKRNDVHVTPSDNSSSQKDAPWWLLFIGGE